MVAIVASSRRRALCAVAIAGGACAERPLATVAGGDDEALCADAPIALRVVPDTVEIDVGPERQATLHFAALALFADGRAIETPAAWTVDRTDLGSIDAQGSYRADGSTGGSALLTARAAGRESSVAVAIKRVETIPHGLSSDISDRFSETLLRDSQRVPPRLLIPADRAEFHAGEAAPRFRWERSGHAFVRIRLSSARSETMLHADGEDLVLSEATWRAIAESTRGDDVHVVLEAADPDGEVVHLAPDAVRIRFCLAGELCDGRDDDCDGAFDESCAPPLGASAGESPEEILCP